MQVSVESTSSIERRMTIGVPADQIDQKVEQRLQQTAKTIRINGFRPGKVPVKVVKKRYGKGVRQEVLDEVMRNSFVEAIGQEGINPVGYPKFEPTSSEEGQDLEFVAIIEVQPELVVEDVSKITLEKPEAEIKGKDVKNMIDVLRRSQGSLKAVKRKCKNKDMLTLDYVGYMDGEAFEGGTGKGQKITLGAGQMIPGFEDGLVGAKAGEKIDLELTFPSDYSKEELAGKDVKFEVTLVLVEDTVLPKMEEEFFSKYGVNCKTEEEFNAEITKNMERELKQAVSNKLKQQIIDSLVEQNDVNVPDAMAAEEVNKLKSEAISQYGGDQQMDLSQLPDDLFKDQAEKRVKTGLLFAAIVKENELKAEASEVDAKIQELASSYESPDEVIEWYGKPENRSQLEALVLEEAVVDFVVSKAKVKAKKMSYEDAVKPEEPEKVEEKPEE